MDWRARGMVDAPYPNQKTITLALALGLALTLPLPLPLPLALALSKPLPYPYLYPNQVDALVFDYAPSFNFRLDRLDFDPALRQLHRHVRPLTNPNL